MTHPDVPAQPVFADPTRTVATRMKAARTAKGWSAKELADQLTKVGLRWDRSVVANLENGRRSSVSVEELLALAYVLDVAPVHLLVPLEEEGYQVTPEWITGSGLVREWIRGKQPLSSTDPRAFFSQVPQEEFRGKEWTPEDIGQKGRQVEMMRKLTFDTGVDVPEGPA